MPNAPMTSGGEQDARKKSHVRRERISDVRPEHEERTVREIDDAHQSENDVESERDQDVQHAERDAVEQLIADLMQHRRALLRVRCGALRPMAGVKVVGTYDLLRRTSRFDTALSRCGYSEMGRPRTGRPKFASRTARFSGYVRRRPPPPKKAVKIATVSHTLGRRNRRAIALFRFPGAHQRKRRYRVRAARVLRNGRRCALGTRLREAGAALRRKTS